MGDSDEIEHQNLHRWLSLSRYLMVGHPRHVLELHADDLHEGWYRVDGSDDTTEGYFYVGDDGISHGRHRFTAPDGVPPEQIRSAPEGPCATGGLRPLEGSEPDRSGRA